MWVPSSPSETFQSHSGTSTSVSSRNLRLLSPSSDVMWSFPHWCQTPPSTLRPQMSFVIGQRHQCPPSRRAINLHLGGSGCPTISLMGSGRGWYAGLQMTNRLARYMHVHCSLVHTQNIPFFNIACGMLKNVRYSLDMRLNSSIFAVLRKSSYK